MYAGCILLTLKYVARNKFFEYWDRVEKSKCYKFFSKIFCQLNTFESKFFRWYILIQTYFFAHAHQVGHSLRHLCLSFYTNRAVSCQTKWKPQDWFHSDKIGFGCIKWSSLQWWIQVVRRLKLNFFKGGTLWCFFTWLDFGRPCNVMKIRRPVGCNLVSLMGNPPLHLCGPGRTLYEFFLVFCDGAEQVSEFLYCCLFAFKWSILLNFKNDWSMFILKF